MAIQLKQSALAQIFLKKRERERSDVASLQIF